MSLNSAKADALIRGYLWFPNVSTSETYKHWISVKDLRRCLACASRHGTIWYIYENPVDPPPIHFLCRCTIERMNSIPAGEATMHGKNGADWVLRQTGELPDYYILHNDAVKAGWKSGEWPSNFIPDKMIGGDIYRNEDGHLPDAPGRVWYEADINYETGKRNGYRIVYSNDGLMFATYDHYETFYEII